MKVLWLCNIMLPVVAEHLGLEASNKEGWISGLMHVVLQRQKENDIQLAVAFPAAEKQVLKVPVPVEGGQCELACYGFRGQYSDRPEIYDETLEGQLKEIVKEFAPDMVHIFGTEYPHTLAMCKVFPCKERILIGIQGMISACAEEYYANLPQEVINSVTLRDILRRDSIKQQQEKFALRGKMEVEALKLAGNVTGRTAWDKEQVAKHNPETRYHPMNETLRASFYVGHWQQQLCEPHSIFVSQGDYPLKGLHYMLLALPRIRETYPGVKLYVAGPDLTSIDTWKQKLKLSGYGKYLRKLIKENKLEKQVCFLGRLSGEEMKAQYLKSNLFVCCSSLENSPNSLGEAMLLGIPCVSAEVGGVPSIFTGGEDGIFYQSRGKSLKEVASNLTEAILKMWENPVQMEEYCANATAHALKNHDGEANYRRLVEIYTDIVGEGDGE